MDVMRSTIEKYLNLWRLYKETILFDVEIVPGFVQDLDINDFEDQWVLFPLEYRQVVLRFFREHDPATMHPPLLIGSTLSEAAYALREREHRAKAVRLSGLLRARAF